MAPPLLVLHTTQSSSASGSAAFMRHKGVMSHRVFDPATGERIQLIRWSSPAKALKNLPGGVETNNRGSVYQLEIVGYAGAVPTYPDRWYQSLATEVRAICTELGVPLRFPCQWLPYPASYGAHSRVRMTGRQWMTATGIVGHQHIPESDHGDPGDLSRLAAILTTPPTRKELDVLFHQAMADLDELYKAYRGASPTPSERQSWGRDMAHRIYANGEDLTGVLVYVEVSLRKETAR
jgi:hypothetical protein